MSWVLVVIAAWLLIAIALGIVLGRAVRHADERAALTSAAPEPNVVMDESTRAGASDTRQQHHLPAARRPLNRPRSPSSRPSARGRSSRRG
ncbi:hypothetical protein ACI78T_06620 [Blastococcus sp. SYSU D00922]